MPYDGAVEEERQAVGDLPNAVGDQMSSCRKSLVVKHLNRRFVEFY